MYSILRVYGNVDELFSTLKNRHSLSMEIHLDRKGRGLTIDLSKSDDCEAHWTEMTRNLDILEQAAPEVMSGAYDLAIDIALDTPEDKRARGLDVYASTYRFGLEFLTMLVRRKIDLDVSIYLSMKPDEDE